MWPQSIQLDGKPLHYTVTVGTLPVNDRRQEDRRGGLYRVHRRGPGPAGHLRAEWRSGRGFRLSEFRRHRPQAHRVRRGGRQPVRSGEVNRQSGHVAGFHRPGVHRSDRHRLQPIAGFGGREQEAVLQYRRRHSLPLAHHLRLAGGERAHELAKISGGRELRRLSRPADHPLPANAARRGDERRGAGLAVPESGAG